jgi:hypothetical protein
MMKKLLLILIALPMIGLGQSWEQTYGIQQNHIFNIGTSVQQTSDGGYISTGSSADGDDVLLFLLKTDGSGTEQWTRIWGDDNLNARGLRVRQTTDGGYIIIGGTGFPNSYDAILIKTDGNGIEQWSKTINNTVLNSVQQTTDGGYIITGMISDTTGIKLSLIKTDGNGIEQWSQTFGTYYDAGNSVQQTTDGGYIITGMAYDTTNSAFSQELYLVKTDGNGIEQWSQTFGTYYAASGNSVQQTTDGGYIITGMARDTTNSAFSQELYLVKTDGSGIEQWSKTFKESLWAVGNSVQQTTDGGYIITGNDLDTIIDSWGDTVYYCKVYLIKTDGNGIEQWSQTFGGGYQNVDTGELSGGGNEVHQTTDGGYIIIGSKYNGMYNVGYDVYLIKTDGSGNVTSTFNIPINSNRKLEKVVDILGRETKQTNQPLFYIYDDGTVEKRIVIE